MIKQGLLMKKYMLSLLLLLSFVTSVTLHAQTPRRSGKKPKTTLSSESKKKLTAEEKKALAEKKKKILEAYEREMENIKKQLNAAKDGRPVATHIANAQGRLDKLVSDELFEEATNIKQDWAKRVAAALGIVADAQTYAEIYNLRRNVLFDSKVKADAATSKQKTLDAINKLLVYLEEPEFVDPEKEKKKEEKEKGKKKL